MLTSFLRHFNVCKAIILFDIFNVVSPGLHFLSNVMKDIESKELIYNAIYPFCKRRAKSIAVYYYYNYYNNFFFRLIKVAIVYSKIPKISPNPRRLYIFKGPF